MPRRSRHVPRSFRRAAVAAFAAAMCAATLAPQGAAGHVYWSSLFGVGRANLDGSGADLQFLPVTTTCGVALAGGRVFWGFDRGSIGVGGLDGSILNVRLLDAPSYACARGGIAADSTHVFWANENQPDVDTIGRANLDGSGVVQRFVDGAINPCGIAVDSSHIYWATGNSGRGPGTTIGRANLDGGGVDEHFITGLPGPCGVAVDGSHVYWANMDTGTIGRANLDGTGVDTAFIAGAGSAPAVPCGVAVDHAHIYWQQEQGPIGRANLDGSGVDPSFIDDPRGNCHLAVDALIPAAVSLQSTPGSVIYGQDMTFAATVGGGGATPGGVVQFQDHDHDVGEPVPLDGQGEAVFDPPFLVDVGDTIAARYRGDGTYSPSAGRLAARVTPARTLLSLTSDANPATEGGQVDVVAAVRNLDTDVAPFGSVQFYIDGVAVLDPQPLDENGKTEVIATDLAVGDFVVEAAYEDDTAAIADFAASRDSYTQHVVARPPLTPAAPPPPAASPTPAIPAAPAQVTVVAGRHPTVRRRHGRFVVDTDEQAGCPGGGPRCTVRVLARADAGAPGRRAGAHRQQVTVGRARLTVKPGRHARVRFTLNRQGARRLRARKRLVLRTTTTSRVGDGPTRTLVRTLTVKRPKAAAEAPRRR